MISASKLYAAAIKEQLLQLLHASAHVMGSFNPSISLRVSNFDPTRIGSRPFPIFTADLVPARAYAHDSFSYRWLTADRHSCCGNCGYTIGWLAQE
jgi:hypothetical protein